MAAYDSIKFNIDFARMVILDECDKVMKDAINRHLGSLEYPGAIYGSEREVISLEYNVVFEDIRAWVMFFGQGLAIEWNNPYLDEYMSSGFWANGRPKSGTIIRRGSDDNYSQYNYKTGELMEGLVGSDPQGEPLEKWQQANLTEKRDVDFWKTIEEIYNTFLEGFNNTALPNIQRRFVTECFTINKHTI